MNRVAWLLVALGVTVGIYFLSRTKRGSVIVEEIADTTGEAVNKLAEFLDDEEGLRLDAYLDNATPPRWTIGRGHLILPSDKVRGQKLHPYGAITRITLAEADEFFARDTREATNAVDDAIDKLSTTNQRTAMISLAFNIGASAFRNSTLVKKFNAGDYIGAANEFSRWIYSGDKSKPNPVLVRRRERERQLFLS